MIARGLWNLILHSVRLFSFSLQGIADVCVFDLVFDEDDFADWPTSSSSHIIGQT